LEINQRREGVLTFWEDVARGAGGWRSYVGDDGGKPERGAPVISWLLWPGELAAGGRAGWVFLEEKGPAAFGVHWKG
jgi:hypothetical protein